MSDQGELFEQGNLYRDEFISAASLLAFDRFVRFHNENVFVYRRYSAIAFEAIQSGADYLGSKAIWERLRLDIIKSTSEPNARAVNPDTNKRFKLCNDYTPYYARLWVYRNPKFKGKFRKRSSMADDISESNFLAACR